eukprot:719889-Pleurochrysis_carterae.AAC.1
MTVPLVQERHSSQARNNPLATDSSDQFEKRADASSCERTVAKCRDSQIPEFDRAHSGLSLSACLRERVAPVDEEADVL